MNDRRNFVETLCDALADDRENAFAEGSSMTMLLRVAAAVLLLAAPLSAQAQQSARVPTVGVLVPGPAGSPIQERSRKALERGLSELGWRPGETIRLQYRYADGRTDRLEELARDLVREKVDVIVARAGGSIRAAKKATERVPVVMSASGYDPVALGFVKSLARPGGKITGLTLLNDELLGKQLELLREVLPTLSRVAVLASVSSPLSAKAREKLEAGARSLGVQLHYVDVRGPGELGAAFDGMARDGIGGLLVRPTRSSSRRTRSRSSLSPRSIGFRRSTGGTGIRGLVA